MLYLLCNDVLNAAVPEALKVQELTLNNGLTVWLNEDHSQPKVFGAVVVKAGAKDCPDTGIAHYFEHMMFKGTDKIGTLNYEAERVLLDSISMKYDELSKTGDEAARKSIQAEINRLSIRSSDYVIPNEFDRLISRYGGSNLNAWTSQDMTVYHNSFSPQYFRQWAELCSERLVHPVFRLFQSELETVYEEKNMYSDNLLNNAMEKVMDRFFAPHPYAYPIIGSTKNLKNPQLSQMSRFFDDYYVAGNMGLILSGDFNTSEMVPLLEKTFGRIRPGVAPRQEVPSPKPLEGAVPMNVLINIPIINACGMIWRGVPAGHPDELKLKIAMRLLNNENGTGSLDKLTSDHKLTEAVAVAYGMKEEGVVATIVLPKIPFHSNKKAKAMVMHDSFFLSDYQVLNIFLTGIGTVGGSLLEQIKQQQPMLMTQNGLKLNVVGIADVNKAIFDRNGIDLENYKEKLYNEGVPNSPERLKTEILNMKSANKPVYERSNTCSTSSESLSPNFCWYKSSRPTRK